MSENKCPSCGASIDFNANECKYCGQAISISQNTNNGQQQFEQARPFKPMFDSVPPKTKNRIVAGILAIVLGGLGVHKFYLGKIGMGILYLVFSWTYIPSIIGVIEGILYLIASDENFYNKHVRKI